MGKDTMANVLKDVAKKYGPIGTMSDVAEDVVGYTTGNLAIDYLTGVGGIPVGRITELYGYESSGKTTTALQAAAELQQNFLSGRDTGFILYLDFEHAMDGEYAADLGLDVDHPSFVLAQPNWLEDGADIAERAIKTGEVRMVIFDSVARMVPRESEFGVRTNAMDRARLMSSLLARLVSLLAENNCAGVCINHMTQPIQMLGRPGIPSQETSLGGRALKFYASLRLAYKVIGHKKGKAVDSLTGDIADQVTATHVKVRATKNKVGIAQREAEVRMRLGSGFDNVWTAIQILGAHKRIAISGAWHYFDRGAPSHAAMPITATGRPGLQGFPALQAFADANPDWRRELIDYTQNLINECGAHALFTVESESSAEDDVLLVSLGDELGS